MMTVSDVSTSRPSPSGGVEYGCEPVSVQPVITGDAPGLSTKKSLNCNSSVSAPIRRRRTRTNARSPTTARRSTDSSQIGRPVFRGLLFDNDLKSSHTANGVGCSRNSCANASGPVTASSNPSQKARLEKRREVEVIAKGKVVALKSSTGRMQVTRHAKDRAQDRVDDHADERRNDQQDGRRNQSGDQLDLLVQLALVDVGDAVHGRAEAACLFTNGHHVRVHFREDLLRRESDRQVGPIDHRLAHIDHFPPHKLVARTFFEKLERTQQGHAVVHQRSQRTRELGVKAVAVESTDDRELPLEPIPRVSPFFGTRQRLEEHEGPDTDENPEPPVIGHEIVRVEQHLRRGRHLLVRLFEEAGELRDNDPHENHDQPGARDDEDHRVHEGLLNAVAQPLDVGKMADEATQDFRQGTGRLAGGNEVHVKRRKDLRKLAQRLRETAPIDEGLVQTARERSKSRVLHPLHQNAQRFVERHSGGQQMRQLLGEKMDLAMGERQRLGSRLRPVHHRRRFRPLPRLALRSRRNCLDLNRKPTLFLHLTNRRRAIVASDHAIDELSIRPFGYEAELRHVWRRTVWAEIRKASRAGGPSYTTNEGQSPVLRAGEGGGGKLVRQFATTAVPVKGSGESGTQTLAVGAVYDRPECPTRTSDVILLRPLSPYPSGSSRLRGSLLAPLRPLTDPSIALSEPTFTSPAP